MNKFVKVCVWGILLGLVGCNASTSDEGVAAPQIGAKADRIGLDKQGSIEFGESQTGHLEGAITYHGYTFDARKGSQITVNAEDPNTDSQTYLWLFGPRDGSFDNKTLAADESNGPASLESIDLPETGTYMVVVSAATSQPEPPTYRLNLRCQSEVCTRNVPNDSVNGWITDVAKMLGGHPLNNVERIENTDGLEATVEQKDLDEFPSQIVKDARAKVDSLDNSDEQTDAQIASRHLTLTQYGSVKGYAISVRHVDYPEERGVFRYYNPEFEPVIGIQWVIGEEGGDVVEIGKQYTASLSSTEFMERLAEKLGADFHDYRSTDYEDNILEQGYYHLPRRIQTQLDETVSEHKSWEGRGKRVKVEPRRHYRVETDSDKIMGYVSKICFLALKDTIIPPDNVDQCKNREGARQYLYFTDSAALVDSAINFN